MRKCYEAVHYVGSFSFQLLHPLRPSNYPQNLPHKPSVRVLPWMWQTKSHPHIKLQSNCSCAYFNLYVLKYRPPLWSSGQSSWLHNGDALWFLWGTNWIYICYVEESRPPPWSSGQSSWLHNGDALWFLWGTNWIYICYVEESRPPLWSSGQSFWLKNGKYCDSCEIRTEFIYAM
jgi:hypothetical protein